MHQGFGIVLVIDDEMMVAELARDILQRFGYTVLLESSGEQAIDLFYRRSNEIVAVVLDVVMPGMDGREVFHRLRAVNPNVKVIISSGYSREQDADDLLKLGAAGFVQKPYRIAELVKAVGETVARK